MKYDFTFELGQTVYLKTDVDQSKRIVTGITIRPSGAITYELTCGASYSWHYDFEIDITKDVLLSTTD